jgi:adenosylcobinamide kinase/adenosylcobinamide-phosphate guanylyltransferase
MTSTLASSPILVLGAAHAGKSELAPRYLAPDRPALVLGTADPDEPSLRKRLAALRALRPAPWDTVETRHDLPAALADGLERYPQLLVDSVHLWLAAATIAEARGEGEAETEARLLALVDELTRVTLCRPKARVVFVTTDVGASLPPQRPIERLLRRIIGLANQRLAATCATVVEVKAGIPLILKGP